MGYELTVEWKPGENEALSGEVKRNLIKIYAFKEDVDFETLRHAFFEYTVCQIIEPYKNVMNKLILALNDEAYKRKEKFVDALKDSIG